MLLFITITVFLYSHSPSIRQLRNGADLGENTCVLAANERPPVDLDYTGPSNSTDDNAHSIASNAGEICCSGVVISIADWPPAEALSLAILILNTLAQSARPGDLDPKFDSLP